MVAFWAAADKLARAVRPPEIRPRRRLAEKKPRGHIRIASAGNGRMRSRAAPRRLGKETDVSPPSSLSGCPTWDQLGKFFFEMRRPRRKPAMYQAREFVDAGGLMSYGVNLPDMFRRTATRERDNIGWSCHQ
jgi:hypothetical protein